MDSGYPLERLRRYWCTNAIAMLPSPTAAATRFTGLKRTSPQAKMPGTLVSSRYGSRSSRQRSADVGPGEDVAVLVARDLRREPVRLGVGADEDVEAAGRVSRRGTGRVIVHVDLAERGVAVHGDDLAPQRDDDVRPRAELIDEVPRHALLECVTAVEDRDAACVAREGERRLAGRVPRADDVDVEPMGRGSIASRGAVVDTDPAEPVETFDCESAPGDAGCEDDRWGAEDVASVEVDGARCRVDAHDRPRDEDLGSEPPGLLEGPTAQLVARDP